MIKISFFGKKTPHFQSKSIIECLIKGILPVFLLLACFSGSLQAKSFALGGWKLDMHYYADAEYTYMSEMPMYMPVLVRVPHPGGLPIGTQIPKMMFDAVKAASIADPTKGMGKFFIDNTMANMSFAGQRAMMMTGVFEGMDKNAWMKMKMDKTSALANHHFNILADLQRDSVRFHVNVQALGAVSTEKDTVAEAALRDPQYSLLQGYLHYIKTDILQIRVGKFLPPFGIYNDVSYITPLFATVVLPEMYEAQPNYLMQTWRRNLLPRNAQFMLTGTHFGDKWEIMYAIYAGEGKDEIRDEEDVGGGLRLRGVYEENIAIGVSFYTGKQMDEVITSDIGIVWPYLSRGTESVIGFDLDRTFRDEKIRWQFEYVNSSYSGQSSQSRSSWYTRLIWEGWDRAKPFLMYDNFKDSGDELFSNTMNRYGIGNGFRINDHVYHKVEYHYHTFSDNGGLPADTDPTHMVRTSLIIAF